MKDSRPGYCPNGCGELDSTGWCANYCMSDDIAHRRFIVRYGQPGHEYEYCINIEGYSINGEFIPQSVADELLRKLVLPLLNRGTRIEIVCQDIHYDEIVEAMEAMGFINDPEGKFLF